MPGSPRPDVLFLAHRVPYPPDKGDRIRAFHMLKWLSRRASVHLACLADEPVDAGSLAALRRTCERVAVVRLGGYSRWARAFGSLALGGTATEGAFSSPGLRSILRRWTREVDFHACVASASSLVPYTRTRGLRGGRTVIDLVDVDSQKWLDYAEAGRGPRARLYRAEGLRLRQIERGLPTWALAVTLVSEAEADLYRRFSAPGPVHAVTNGVDLECFRPAARPEERGCVFVGALDYRPNVEAVRWFCREAWPEIRRRSPEARLSLVGRKPTPEVLRLGGSPGVEVIGQVPDVRPYVARAAVVLAPLGIARGVQNKILEGLAMGKAVVASPQALEGLGAVPGLHLLTASAPHEWAETALRLLDDPDRRRRLGEAGRRYVEEHHHWDRCLGPLEAILDLPEGGPPAGPPAAAGASNRPARLAPGKDLP